MENKVFEKTEQFIEDALQKNAAAIEEIMKNIESAQAAKAKAEQDAETAFNKADAKSHRKAKMNAKAAAEDITTYNEILNRRNESPIISNTQYESAVSDVLAEMARMVAEDKEKVIALADQIAQIADREKEFVATGNALLKKLQHDLYRDADCTRTDSSGHKQHDSYREKRFKDTNVVYFSDRIIGSDFYKNSGGTRKLPVPRGFFNRAR